MAKKKKPGVEEQVKRMAPVLDETVGCPQNSVVCGLPLPEAETQPRVHMLDRVARLVLAQKAQEPLIFSFYYEY